MGYREFAIHTKDRQKTQELLDRIEKKYDSTLVGFNEYITIDNDIVFLGDSDGSNACSSAKNVFEATQIEIDSSSFEVYALEREFDDYEYGFLNNIDLNVEISKANNITSRMLKDNETTRLFLERHIGKPSSPTNIRNVKGLIEKENLDLINSIILTKSQNEKNINEMVGNFKEKEIEFLKEKLSIIDYGIPGTQLPNGMIYEKAVDKVLGVKYEDYEITDLSNFDNGFDRGEEKILHHIRVAYPNNVSIFAASMEIESRVDLEYLKELIAHKDSLKILEELSQLEVKEFSPNKTEYSPYPSALDETTQTITKDKSLQTNKSKNDITSSIEESLQKAFSTEVEYKSTIYDLGKFDDYSFKNRLLLRNQLLERNQGISFVPIFKPFSAWKKEGVSVLKGEKAYSLIVAKEGWYEKGVNNPVFANTQAQADKLMKEGKEMTPFVTYFLKPGTFHINQTNSNAKILEPGINDGLTKEQSFLGREKELEVKFLSIKGVLEKEGLKINEVPGIEANALLRTTITKDLNTQEQIKSIGNEIILNKELAPESKITALLHEYGHYSHQNRSNGQLESDKFIDDIKGLKEALDHKELSSLKRAVDELQAESFSFLVAKDIGIETKESMNYLGAYNNLKEKVVSKNPKARQHLNKIDEKLLDSVVKKFEERGKELSEQINKGQEQLINRIQSKQHITR